MQRRATETTGRNRNGERTMPLTGKTNRHRRAQPIRPVIVRLLALAFAAGWAGSAGAGELEDLSLEQLINVEVFSASKFPQKVIDAPSVVTIVTAADIKAFGYRNLDDVLRSIRGLYVSNDRNYSYLGTRGFARPGDYNTRVLLLIDGHRVNDTVYDQAPTGYDFPLDIDLVERVEFVPGPGSALFGSSAFFGVINVITKNADGAPGLQVSGEAASLRTAKARVSYGKRDGDLNLLLSASGYGSRGDDLRFPEFADPASNDGVANGLDYERNYHLYAKLGIGGLTLQASHLRRPKGIPTASFAQLFNDPRSMTTDDRTLLGLNYSRAVAERTELFAALSYSRYDYDGVYVFDAPPVVANTDGARSRWLNAELRLLSTAFQSHKLVGGIEYRKNLMARQFNFDELGDYLDDRRTGRTLGVYVQDEYALSERWTLTAGVRHDRDYGEISETHPRFALVFKPQPQTAVKLLYGSAFRAPNVYEAYYVTDAGTQKANPALRPETIRTAELALEHYLRNNWKLTASAFAYRIRDLIDTTLDPNDGLTFFDNAGQNKARGVDLETDYIGEDGSRLHASYSWQSAKNQAGAVLTNSPRHLAKLKYQMPLLGQTLRAGLELQAQSSMRSVSDGRLPGYLVTNLTLSSFKPFKGLELSASVYNLFDRDLVWPASVEHVDGLGRQLQAIPQDGRLWRLKASYAF
jgi:iron complex outermembrane receptor protein